MRHGRFSDGGWRREMLQEVVGSGAIHSVGIGTGTKLYISNLEYGVSNEDIKVFMCISICFSYQVRAIYQNQLFLLVRAAFLYTLSQSQGVLDTINFVSVYNRYHMHEHPICIYQRLNMFHKFIAKIYDFFHEFVLPKDLVVVFIRYILILSNLLVPINYKGRTC